MISLTGWLNNMKIRKDLMSSIGLNEHAKFKSLFLVILLLSAVSIFADGVMEIIAILNPTEINIPKMLISLILFLLVYLVYLWLGKKELKLYQTISQNKENLIVFMPSNLDLLKKIIKNHKIKKFYFIRTTKVFKPEEYNEIKSFLKDKNLKYEEFKVNDKDNPKEIKDSFFKIVSQVDSKDSTVVNITPGGTVSSLVLNECANYVNIDVEYLQSNFDDKNQPIDGSENTYIINFKQEFVK